MIKILEGIITSIKMQRTAVVSISRRYPHPLYKKLIKRERKIMADTAGFAPNIGDRVKIAETSPISKAKHFKIMEVIKNGSA